MRIIAGRFRSRCLRTLAGRHVRPIPDRLRETLFDILQAQVPGSVFVDAYAGSGSVGLEGLSRGAAKVFLIENHRAALAVIRENLKSLGITDDAEILAEDTCRGFNSLVRRCIQADICFLGPPYTVPREYDRALGLLGKIELVRFGGLVVAQHAPRQELKEGYGRLRRTRVVVQGTNALCFYEHA